MSDIFHAGISGARGRMGRAVDLVLDARDDVVVAARFDWGETPDLSLCDVVIDFSTPEASVALAKLAAERGGPALVIGSTGFTEAQETEILAAAEKVAIVRSGNFSLGVNILIGLVEHAAQRLDPRDWDIEVIEAHHRLEVNTNRRIGRQDVNTVAQFRGNNLVVQAEFFGRTEHTVGHDAAKHVGAYFLANRQLAPRQSNRDNLTGLNIGRTGDNNYFLVA